MGENLGGNLKSFSIGTTARTGMSVVVVAVVATATYFGVQAGPKVYGNKGISSKGVGVNNSAAVATLATTTTVVSVPPTSVPPVSAPLPPSTSVVSTPPPPTTTALIVVPQVSSLNVQNGPVEGGTAVWIFGVNLPAVTSVLFGSQSQTIYERFPSYSAIEVLSPPGDAGTVDVRLVANGLLSPVVAQDHFTYGQGQ